MGYLHKINKDKAVRNYFNNNEMEKILLNYYINVSIDKRYKFFIYYKFVKSFHLNSSSSRIVNICLKTGRSSWIIRQFRLSRMSFKELAEFGKLNGVRRAIW